MLESKSCQEVCDQSNQKCYSVYVTEGMTLEAVERLVIEETLRRYRDNRTRTARVLGIGIRTLQRKLKQYNSQTLQ